MTRLRRALLGLLLLVWLPAGADELSIAVAANFLGTLQQLTPRFEQTSGHVRLLAIADPKNAPYGAAAQQVLTALGVWDEFNRDHKIALAENINQAWQFAATGSAAGYRIKE